MKKLLLVLAVVLSLSVGVVALAVDSPKVGNAADSPILSDPPAVGDVSVAGVSVELTYNENTYSQAQALADAVKEGKTELEFFELSKDDLAEIQKAGFDPKKVSVDDFLYIKIYGYKEKPESITFKLTFPVPYKTDQKVLVLMGVGEAPDITWTLQEAVVNKDGSLSITLKDFPDKPFMLSILS